MPRLAFKPDASFFRKIAIGAVGTRAICQNLALSGHNIVELERGSTDTKLWKEVKRKRVRIPDLVCTKCGLRIESRTKTKTELSMSHTADDETRAWDYGMVNEDLIAFPVCEPISEKYWSSGRLKSAVSYWHERNLVAWQARSYINYFYVSSFRNTPHDGSNTKGVTEGSETAISWDATFATCTGVVEAADNEKVTLRRTSNNHLQTWSNKKGRQVHVKVGEKAHYSQVLISRVDPVRIETIPCPDSLPDGHINRLLTSRERTQRFTGVKLARLRREPQFRDIIAEIEQDTEEDIYIRLECTSYLASVCDNNVEIFSPYLDSNDGQTQLEAVIALGEAATGSAIDLLCRILKDQKKAYFLRSAAAWSLGRTGTPHAVQSLIAAFADLDQSIREEALTGIVSIGDSALPVLLARLREPDIDNDVAAGIAEALRQQQPLADEVLQQLAGHVQEEHPSHWAVWLAGLLPRQQMETLLAGVEDSSPDLHYAIGLLWSFMESWISRSWELRPQPIYPAIEGQDVT
jgi:hypothetical protein